MRQKVEIGESSIMSMQSQEKLFPDKGKKPLLPQKEGDRIMEMG